MKNPRTTPVLIMALCSLVLTFVYATLDANGENGHTHTNQTAEHSKHGGMMHGTIELSGTEDIPTVELEVYKDPKKGWNIHLVIMNFRFAPEHASTAHVPGEGHAHLYVDGTKITRLYGEWYYLEHLPPGTHEIEVTLNSNSHDDLVVNGITISDIEIVTVPAK
jgi:hypothetical protein